jgi:hypothetical protein
MELTTQVVPNRRAILLTICAFEQHETCPQEHEVRLDVSAFVTGLAKELAKNNKHGQRNQNHAVGQTWLMLAKVRPVIGGQAGGLHGQVGVGCKTNGERRIGTGLSQSFPRTSDEKATGDIVTTNVTLELSWVLAKPILHQVEQTASDPGSIDLKFHDKEFIWPQ